MRKILKIDYTLPKEDLVKIFDELNWEHDVIESSKEKYRSIWYVSVGDSTWTALCWELISDKEGMIRQAKNIVERIAKSVPAEKVPVEKNIYKDENKTKIKKKSKEKKKESIDTPLTMDAVLDKISLTGMESLSPEEIDFLKKISKSI